MPGGIDRRALLGAATGIAGAALAAPAKADTLPPAATVRRSAEFTLTNAEGYTYRIQVAMPLQTPPPGGFPTLFVLDGNSAFGIVTDMMRVQSRYPDATGIPPAIVVAIGYPIDGPFDSERRVFDLTVPTPASHFPPRPDGKPREDNATGGADAFARFIIETVQPEIEQRFPVDRSRKVLVGHSLGGLFCLHTLFHHPGHFRGYVALSPSVWWKRRYILAAARDFVAAQGTKRWTESLFIGVGEREQDGTEAEETRMVDNARLVSEAMQPLVAHGFQTGFAVIPDEHHRSVVPSIISKASRFIFAAMA